MNINNEDLTQVLSKPPMPVLDSMKNFPSAGKDAKGAKFVIVVRDDGIFCNLAPFMLWTETVAIHTLGDGVQDIIRMGEATPNSSRMELYTKDNLVRARVFGVFDSKGLRTTREWSLLQSELNSLYMYLLQWTEDQPLTVYEYLVHAIAPLLKLGSDPWRINMKTVTDGEALSMMQARTKLKEDVNLEVKRINNSIIRLSETMRCVKVQRATLAAKKFPLQEFLANTKKREAKVKEMCTRNKKEAGGSLETSAKVDGKSTTVEVKWKEILPASEFGHVNAAFDKVENDESLFEYLTSLPLESETKEGLLQLGLKALVLPTMVKDLKWPAVGTNTEYNTIEDWGESSFSEGVKCVWLAAMATLWNQGKFAAGDETNLDGMERVLLAHLEETYGSSDGSSSGASVEVPVVKRRRRR